MLLSPGSLNRRLVLLLALGLAGTASSVAYAEPVGPEFVLPAQSTASGLAYGSDPQQPSWLTAGRGLVDDSEGEEIYSSRVSPAGVLLSGPGQVSDDPDDPLGYPHDNPQAPSIAYNAAGNEFLVVWAQGFRIWARFLNGDGKAPGDPFQISSEGPDHYSPQVAYNADRGEYLVVWETDIENSADEETQVMAQRLDVDGDELAPDDQQISSNPALDDPGAQGFGYGPPDIAYNHASGGYLVTWSPTYSLDQGEQVVAQLLDATGDQTGPDDFHPAGLDSAFTGRNLRPAVASGGSEYLLVWTNEFEIYGQRLSGSGGEVGANDFRLSDSEPSSTSFLTTSAPAVAHNPVSGQWLVGWEGANLVGGVLTEGIFGQHLALDGSEIGTDDFLVSGGHRGFAAMASSTASDEFLFTWNADGAAGARRVQSTNCTLTQSCQGPTTPSGNPPSSGLPALSAIRASLKRSLGTAVRALKRLGLDGLPRRRRFVIGDFKALTAGKVAVSLTARPGPKASSAKAMVVARGTRAIPAAGRYRVSVRLTKQGRRKLAGLARARMRLEIRFRDRSGRLVTASRSFVVPG